MIDKKIGFIKKTFGFHRFPSFFYHSTKKTLVFLRFPNFSIDSFMKTCVFRRFPSFSLISWRKQLFFKGFPSFCIVSRNCACQLAIGRLQLERRLNSHKHHPFFHEMVSDRSSWAEHGWTLHRSDIFSSRASLGSSETPNSHNDSKHKQHLLKKHRTKIEI